MGVDADAVEQKVAFIKCKGSCDVTRDQANYIGVRDCRSAVLCGISVTDCEYGCLGLGSCATVCPQDAITVKNGVASVNRSKCVGCGLCAKACPRGLIELVPASHFVAVQCSNKDRGPQVKKVCSCSAHASVSSMQSMLRTALRMWITQSAPSAANAPRSALPR